MIIVSSAHKWVSAHFTKLLGLVTGLIAVAAGVDGIIPPQHLKWYMFVLGAATFLRGWWNSTQSSTPPSE